MEHPVILFQGHCEGSSSSSETELSRCLEDVGVSARDTRDFQGRGRFLVYQPEFLLVPGKLPWTEKHWSSSKYLSKEVHYVYTQGSKNSISWWTKSIKLFALVQ